jgi:hypothetical protein
VHGMCALHVQQLNFIASAEAYTYQSSTINDGFGGSGNAVDNDKNQSYTAGHSCTATSNTGLDLLPWWYASGMFFLVFICFLILFFVAPVVRFWLGHWLSLLQGKWRDITRPCSKRMTGYRGIQCVAISKSLDFGGEFGSLPGEVSIH